MVSFLLHMSAHASCSFFYASPHRRLSRFELRQTSVNAAAMQGTAAVFVDWMHDPNFSDNSSNNGSGVEVWLRVYAGEPTPRAGQRHVAAAADLTLVAACRLRPRCPSGAVASALVPRSTAVLANDAGHSDVRLTYACAGATQVFLHERVYRWTAEPQPQSQQSLLRRVKERVLLALDNVAPPYAVHTVMESSGQSGLVVLQAAQHVFVFHLRAGASVQEGLLPSIAELHTQWQLTQAVAQHPHAFRQGCFSGTLMGLLSHDSDRHASTFHLAALLWPLAGASAQTRVLLEMTTPALHDADGDLAVACGLAQRLVYSWCDLTRTDLQLFPLLETTRVVLEVQVEGAVLGKAGGPSGVMWQPCGRQRYEGAVRQRQGALGTAEWSVEPLIKVWSRSQSESDDAHTLLTATSSRVSFGERQAIACVSTRRGKVASFSSLIAQRGRDCFLAVSSFADAGLTQKQVSTPFLSAQCQLMESTWWQLPSSLPLQWVCDVTRCSLSDWLLLFLASCTISFFFRVYKRYGGWRR